MAVRIQREEAIQLLCSAELSRLTRQQRAEQLETMLCEDWESHPRWSSLPATVQQEFAQRRERDALDIDEPCAGRYDPVLMLALAYQYRGTRTEFLLARLRESGYEFGAIDGEPESLYACPCCGYNTLDARADYDICGVCWWEDSGRDNHNAKVTDSGPNNVSLARARVNFLREGIFDPSRGDLRRLQEPRTKYERGRIFELSMDGYSIREPAAGWSASLDDER